MAAVAYAIVRADPPEIYLADDVDVLHRVVAFEVVARTDPARLKPGRLDEMRRALLDERWADAAVDWIAQTGIEIDVYTQTHVFTEADLPPQLMGAQLQFAPLFRQ